MKSRADHIRDKYPGRYLLTSTGISQHHGRMADSTEAQSRQEGGDHYKKYPIQPVEYITANGLGYCEGNVVKYVTRYKDKNGVEDLRKAIHYLELLIEEQTRDSHSR